MNKAGYFLHNILLIHNNSDCEVCGIFNNDEKMAEYACIVFRSNNYEDAMFYFVYIQNSLYLNAHSSV